MSVDFGDKYIMAHYCEKVKGKGDVRGEVGFTLTSDE